MNQAVGRFGKRLFALTPQPRNCGRVSNLVSIAAPRQERPRFVVRRSQEACDMPVGPAKLEGLNDFRLYLRARIGLCKFRGQIHATPGLGPVRWHLSGAKVWSISRSAAKHFH